MPHLCHSRGSGWSPWPRVQRLGKRPSFLIFSSLQGVTAVLCVLLRSHRQALCQPVHTRVRDCALSQPEIFL